MKIMLSSSLSILLLVGCASKVRDHKEVVAETIEKETLPKPLKWDQVVDDGTVQKGWLKDFDDPVLERLVDESLKNNHQIRAMQAQVDRSNALVKQAASALKPTVGLGGDYSSANVGADDNIYSAGLTASWEADVWGRIEASVTSAKESAAATQSDFAFARQSLAAATAKGWYMTTTSKLQADYAKSIVDLRTKVLEIVKMRNKVGIVSMRDVHLATSDLASAKEAHLKALTALESAQRSLELLLGRYPSADIESAESLKAVPAPIPAGIPSELLERRPDLVAAEQRVAAAFYKEREAELLHLPTFKFSLGAGINDLSNAIGSLGAGVFAPLYDGGAIASEVEAATATQKETIEQYGQKALEAFKEVETTLSLEGRLEDQQQYLSSVVDENRKALGLTETTFKIGKTDYLEISQVQNRLIASEIALLDISSKRLFNRIDLYLALGGGLDEQ